MKGDRIRYRGGYKYQLINDYAVQLVYVRPKIDIVTEFIELDRSGILLTRHGYAWDGPSNPFYKVIPRVILRWLLKRFMRGSLVHDALAQLMRDGYLDQCFFTPMNRELQEICIEDGMTTARALVIFSAVEYLNDHDWCKPGTDGGKPLLTAP